MLQWNDLELRQGKEWEQGKVTIIHGTTRQKTAQRLDAMGWIPHLFYTNSIGSHPKPRAKDPHLDPIPEATKCENNFAQSVANVA
jgi:hypothetical protein